MLYMDGYRESESRTRSETSGLAGHESVELAQQDSPMIESMSSEWTDEKHNLYLKSMEASFVNQLNNSIGLLGWRSRKGRSVPNLSGEVNCSTCRPSGQFKVHQRGGWQKINFRRPESQLSSAKDSRGFLTSPWIQQFTPARKPDGATSPAHQEGAIQSRGINLNWKKAVLCCPATNSKLSHFGNSCHHDFVESNTEMSGQNFVDEDIEGERASSSFSSKRLKSLKTDTSSSDQVVPHGKTPVEEDVTECISAAK
ncbi:PREDICTED: uncharacterized protein LOC105120623 [Populus euphratica]|uniref:Uncharacterized protein LOC105120623 n=1 Tax=Populus euphratica TaxID=75702 RepID=A0AAJ6TT87_POPEU|nr:PREDICTED: uncharacterized protein LOC105120623 [Populus euphratica]